MYLYKKYMRLIVMTSSLIAYSCYIASQENNSENEKIVFEVLSEEGLSVETKMFCFLVGQYAQMINQGQKPESVHQLIQEKFKEKPELGGKVWDKVQIIAAQTPSQASYAFSEKK